MKRSHTVVLTAVVAAAVVTASGQTLPAKAGSVDCKEARKTAKAKGTAVPQECVANPRAVLHGGFGALGLLHGATG
jgi:hypothetical protein